MDSLQELLQLCKQCKTPLKQNKFDYDRYKWNESDAAVNEKHGHKSGDLIGFNSEINSFRIQSLGELQRYHFFPDIFDTPLIKSTWLPIFLYNFQ